MKNSFLWARLLNQRTTSQFALIVANKRTQWSVDISELTFTFFFCSAYKFTQRERQRDCRLLQTEKAERNSKKEKQRSREKISISQNWNSPPLSFWCARTRGRASISAVGVCVWVTNALAPNHEFSAAKVNTSSSHSAGKHWHKECASHPHAAAAFVSRFNIWIAAHRARCLTSKPRRREQ